RVESDGDDRVSFGRAIEIGPEESTGDAVCIGCSITVKGQVDGDAVAVGGSVHVLGGGVVQGNAVGVGGAVRLDSGATVDGDAVAIGGSVQVDEGATVEGQRSTVGWGGGWGSHKGNGWKAGWPLLYNSDAGELFWGILRALFLMMLCCVSVLLARGSMERTSRRLAEEPWKAIFAGLLTQLLFFPVLLFVTLILAVSIVGIPLLVLVPVAVLALLIATLLGFASVAQSLGRWGAQRFGWKLSEPFLPVIVGVAMIQGVTVLARIVGLPGGFLGIFALVLVALGFFLKYAAWTMGLGAMTLSLLGRDWRRPGSGPEPALSEAPNLRTSGVTESIDDDVPMPPPPVDAASFENGVEDAAEGTAVTERRNLPAAPAPPKAPPAPADGTAEEA
ncbi:MAG: polymer-forming cytoskeletal protein, partial [Thermoanaerobaculia bacterium]